MKLIVRAVGMAAAALTLFAGPGYAASVESASVEAAAASSIYQLHAEAVIAAGEAAIAETAAPAAPAAPEAELTGHALSTVTATMIGLADSALPGAATGPRPLADLVALHAADDIADPEQHCLAGAVYFEARSEPLEGQLAVAEVVLNRAASGKYPRTLCGVVTQRAQFSFIQRGKFPRIDKSSAAWRKAVAIARIANEKLAGKVAPDVLWYHATYVSPGWGKRLNRVARIGAHIFYS